MKTMQITVMFLGNKTDTAHKTATTDHQVYLDKFDP